MLTPPGPWGLPSSLASEPSRWAESKLIKAQLGSPPPSPLREMAFTLGAPSTHQGVVSGLSPVGHQTSSPHSLSASGIPSRVAANGQSRRKRLKGWRC